MKRKEILETLDYLIMWAPTCEQYKALKLAKMSVSKEWRYRFLSSLVLAITTIIIFGSFVAMAYIMY